jgi:hypothetical protein
MAEEFDDQRAIDRACAAQSSDLLPKPKIQLDKLEAVKQRVEAQKAGYKHPPRF